MVFYSSYSFFVNYQKNDNFIQHSRLERQIYALQGPFQIMDLSVASDKSRMQINY